MSEEHHEPQKEEPVEGGMVAVEELPERKVSRAKNKPAQPPPYHVIIWNDEVHTYEYVIELLMRLFSHPLQAAEEITKRVDKEGKGIAYTCHMELAELKRDQILGYGADWRMAESNCSIRATIEPAPD